MRDETVVHREAARTGIDMPLAPGGVKTTETEYRKEAPEMHIE
jgi:hypothetical protein